MVNVNKEVIAEVSQTANKFKSSIVIQYENKYIDVKSILGLFVTLVDGKSYVLHIIGEDNEEATKAMVDVFHKHNIGVTIAE